MMSIVICNVYQDYMQDSYGNLQREAKMNFVLCEIKVGEVLWSTLMVKERTDSTEYNNVRSVDFNGEGGGRRGSQTVITSP